MAADDPRPQGQRHLLGVRRVRRRRDLTEIAAYAAEVGNRRVGTTAQRNAAVTEENGTWEGLIWGDTTDGNEYRFTSGSWVILFPPRCARPRTRGGTKKRRPSVVGRRTTSRRGTSPSRTGALRSSASGASVIVGKQLAANIAGTFQPVLNGNTIGAALQRPAGRPRNAPIPCRSSATIPMSGRAAAVRVTCGGAGIRSELDDCLGLPVPAPIEVLRGARHVQHRNRSSYRPVPASTSSPTERIALQFLSLKVDFDQMKADEGSGDRLRPNEGNGRRSAATTWWNNRAALGIVVATAADVSALRQRERDRCGRDDGERPESGADVGGVRLDCTRRRSAAASRGLAGTRGAVAHRGAASRHRWSRRTRTPVTSSRRAPNRPTPKPTTPAPPVAPPGPLPRDRRSRHEMVNRRWKQQGAPRWGHRSVRRPDPVYHTQGQKDADQVGRSMGILKPGQNTAEDPRPDSRLGTVHRRASAGPSRAVKQAGGYIDAHYEGKFCG